MSVQENIGQYHIVVAELERLLPLHSTSRHQKVDQGQGPIEMLPRTLRNNYEYMLQVAAKLGKLQDLVAGVKERFLENRHKVIQLLVEIGVFDFWPSSA